MPKIIDRTIAEAQAKKFLDSIRNTNPNMSELQIRSLLKRAIEFTDKKPRRSMAQIAIEREARLKILEEKRQAKKVMRVERDALIRANKEAKKVLRATIRADKKAKKLEAKLAAKNTAA